MKNMIKLFGIIAMLAIIGCTSKNLSGSVWHGTLDFDDEITISFTGDNVVTILDGDTMNGTYVINGNSISITVGHNTIIGTISGNKMTLQYLFEKSVTFTKKQ